MAVQEAVGLRAYIGGTGALMSESGWIELGEVVNSGTIERQFNEITHVPQATGNTEIFKGSRRDGTMTLQFGQDLSDAGQEALDDAFEDRRQAYNFRFVSIDGDEYRLKAKVMSKTTDFSGGADSIISGQSALAIMTGSVVVVPA